VKKGLKLLRGEVIGAYHTAGVSKSFLEPGTALRGYPAQPMRDQLRHEATLRHLGSMKERLDRLERLMMKPDGE